MNNSTTTKEDDDEPDQSEANITTTFPQNSSGFNESSIPPQLPSPIGNGFLTNATNSSKGPFNIISNNNSTDQTGNETNSSLSGPLWGLMQEWNGSHFWNGGGDDRFGRDTNTTEVTPISGPTMWEGYVLGLFCLAAALLFIMTPAWYMDRRRHMEFVGSERREARSGRRRRRRRRRRRHRFLEISGMSQDEEQEGFEGQDTASSLTEEYILSMLVTRPIEALDLCLEGHQLKETPSLTNVVSDETDATVTISSNKDHDIEDDESYDPNEDSCDLDDDTSMDDEDADCCAICLQGYKIGDEICNPTQSPCSHYFHRGCLVPWLLKHNVCPCCRVQYLPLPREKGDNEAEESELLEPTTTTGPSILEIPSSMTYAALGDNESTVRIDEEVGSDENGSLEGEPTELTVGMKVDHPTPLEQSLPSTPSESDSEQAIRESEEVIKEEMGCDESGHEKPTIFLDITALSSPSAASLDQMQNGGSRIKNEEYDIGTQTERDLEAQASAISSHDAGNDPKNDADLDDAAPDATFSVPIPQRRLVRRVSSAESSADETSLSA
ncbi:unnamed protein product [Cylindrotheca closterium]|uniref:RING-type domain-containing protein n=1 Tax=Cylindrotheca closterium TaxID=2856 RepID=A0AAD2JGM2_9STRA|nr:unnamed protein product [Cylindrotheca closterium]